MDAWLEENPDRIAVTVTEKLLSDVRPVIENTPAEKVAVPVVEMLYELFES
jgi:hypothetical protein